MQTSRHNGDGIEPAQLAVVHADAEEISRIKFLHNKSKKCSHKDGPVRKP